jgi:choline-sulfatase
MHGHSAMIRKDGWKYCSYAGDSNELYNLSNDPLELTNLAHHPEHKATREKLEAELSALLSGDGKEIS